MVEVIGTSACQKCKATTRKLDRQGTAYTYRDASEVPELVAKAKAAGAMSFPIVARDGEVLWTDLQWDRISSLA